MAFPVGWPPRPATAVRSIRFFVSGTTTAKWSDNAYLFINGLGANTYQPTPYVPAGSSGPGIPAAVGDRNIPGSPMGAGNQKTDVVTGPGAVVGVGNTQPLIWSHQIRISNDGTSGEDLQFSFSAATDEDTSVAGVLKAGESVEYNFRYEAGIALRINGNGAVLTGTAAQTFPFTATVGQTLVVDVSFDGGGTFPVQRTFTWPVGGVGPFANIAALVAALNTASSWDGGTLPAQFVIGNSGNTLTITSLIPGAATQIKVDAASTGIGGATNASLQFGSGQTATNGTGTAGAFRVEAW